MRELVEKTGSAGMGGDGVNDAPALAASSGSFAMGAAGTDLIKGLFVLLAPFGLVALWLAVLADMGTSITLTLNGLRLFRRGNV